MTSGTPLVSVIIPCFARTARDLALLDETLATLHQQTCQDFEALVVDDGSPEDIESTVRRHARCDFMRQTNAGSAIARNTGIAASRGRYLVFLDADDHLLAAALEAGVRELAAHPDCGFVVGAREEMSYEGTPVPWGVPAPPEGAGDVYTALLGFEWYIIPPSSAMFRRDAVEEVGGFRDPWGADDLDFYLRVARLHPVRCYQTPPVTRYRRYSTSSSRDGRRMLHSIREVYARQWPFVQGSAEREHAFHAGLTRLTDIFTDCLVENVTDRVRARNWRGAAQSAVALARERPAKLARALSELRRGSALGLK